MKGEPETVSPERLRRRWHQLPHWVHVSIVLVIVFTAYLGFALYWHSLIAAVVPGLFLAIALVGVVLGLREAHARSRVMNSESRVCPGCNYDLRTLPDAGRCPECARPFSKD